MKTFISLSLLALLTTPAMAQSVIKTCTADLLDFDSEVPVTTRIDIIKKIDGSLEALTSVKNAEHLKDEATVTTYQIKVGLKQEQLVKDDDLDKLNDGEKLIVHAMAMTEDPELDGKFSAGMKLAEVRSVKVYNIGKASKWGMIGIVEAKDANGKELGSFFGGFLIAACK